MNSSEEQKMETLDPRVATVIVSLSLIFCGLVEMFTILNKSQSEGRIPDEKDLLEIEDVRILIQKAKEKGRQDYLSLTGTELPTVEDFLFWYRSPEQAPKSWKEFMQSAAKKCQ